MIFDTHTHLNFPELSHNLDAILSRCSEQGISRYIVPGVDKASWRDIAQLATNYSGVYGAYGLHPVFIESHETDDLLQLEHLLNDSGNDSDIVALGEIGLDKRISQYEKQLHFFESQLEIAERLSRPIIVHCVKAHDDVHRLIHANHSYGGVLHAFSGSAQLLNRYLDLGMMIGVGAVLTRPSAKKTREAIASAPLESLVLETDSPDMKVYLQSGEVINTPLALIAVLEQLCELRSESRDRIVQTLWENSLRVFSLDE